METISLDDIFNEDLQTQEEVKEETVEEQPTEETTEKTTVEETQEEPTQEEQTTSDVEEVTEDTSIIGELTEHFGYEIEGEFPDDVEGLKTFTGEVAKKMVTAEFDNLAAQYPDVSEYMQYRMNGGDPEKFFKVNFDEPDYSKVELSEDNEIQSKEVIKAFYKKQGFDEAEALEMIKDYEDTGILHKQASKALPKLVNSQRQERITLKETQKQEAIKQQQETTKAWENIEEAIISGNISGINIPEADKKNFFDWMAVPTEKGKSSMQVAEETMSLEQMLAIRYLLFKGGDISKLVSAKQKTQKAESLRSRLSKGNNNRLKGSSQHISKRADEVQLNYMF